MKLLASHFPGRLALCAALLFSGLVARAFPPAPHHTFYGMVRDEWGNPIESTGCEVVFETMSGVKIKTQIIPGLQAGVNYTLKVPMDSGLTSDAYQATAMRPTVPFTIKIYVGRTVYLPIEMKGNLAQLGQPGRRTLLNLTLGQDSDGDGLPDAWEKALLAQAGGGKTIADVKPGDDTDHDGLSNLQEYLAGTYAFDPKDGFTLKVAGVHEGRPVLEFLTIAGRSYEVVGSADLKNWSSLEFLVPGQSGTNGKQVSYRATDVKVLKVEVPAVAGEDQSQRFFRLIVR